jgi:cell division protein FtsZ
LSWEYVEDDLSEDVPDLRIRVIGCGGAGCNSIDRLVSIGVRGAETIAVNTDRRHLARIKADKRLLIGAGLTQGFGAGGDPIIGEECAINAQEPLNQLLYGSDLTFITVGMGGGTGTGAAPIIAEMAKRKGSVVIAVATTPFRFEKGRMDVARKGLKNLERFVDTLLIIDNNRLLEMVPNLPIKQAFGVMDQLISEVIKGLVEAITEPSLINLDFADLRTVVAHGGISTVLWGENADPVSVVSDALNNPLLDIDFRGATGALVHVTGGKNLTLKRVEKVFQGITDSLDPNANIICGARVDESQEGIIRVMAVITGIAPKGKERVQIEDFDDIVVRIER